MRGKPNEKWLVIVSNRAQWMDVEIGDVTSKEGSTKFVELGRRNLDSSAFYSAWNQSLSFSISRYLPTKGLK